MTEFEFDLRARAPATMGDLLAIRQEVLERVLTVHSDLVAGYIALIQELTARNVIPEEANKSIERRKVLALSQLDQCISQEKAKTLDGLVATTREQLAVAGNAAWEPDQMGSQRHRILKCSACGGGFPRPRPVEKDGYHPTTPIALLNDGALLCSGACLLAWIAKDVPPGVSSDAPPGAPA